MMADKKAGDLKFDEALEKLEGIVRRLESGQADLEESLDLYQEGVSIARQCREVLTSAELKVKMLLGELEGEVAEAETSIDVDASSADDGGQSEDGTIPF